METELQFDGHRRHTAWIRDTIHRHGWAVQAVLAEPDTGEPDHAYTIGLTALHHPELLIAGLHPHDAAALLNQLATRIRAGDPPPADTTLDDLAPPRRHHLLTLDAAASDELLLHANALYQHPDGPPVAALQIIWSDPTGRLPWEAGCTGDATHQPLAGPPPDPPHRTTGDRPHP
ncbi:MULTISPECIES: DUF4262 domain-containing protein [Frankia]|uniref:DUF4262 domain-containing protein n=1 Tax=Frankia alni (strain DSM 45986 / CECT 9034 / ACN14a) TaxID=326424 RepID=Q0RJ95_FRAAA|nr:MULTISPECIES: DUF4262 domain-containing protein [Frankia]CAJ62417.1 hypothetical protein FRAAL3774 [Frankia alni ACN14a]